MKYTQEKHPPLSSEGLTHWSPHPLFVLTSIDLSFWAIVEECIRFRARVPARSLDATPFSLPVMLRLPCELAYLLIYEPVSGRRSQHLSRRAKIRSSFHAVFIWYAGGAVKLSAGFVPVWHRKPCLTNPAVGKSRWCWLGLLVSYLAHDQDFSLALIKWDSPFLGWHPYSLILFRGLGCVTCNRLGFNSVRICGGKDTTEDQNFKRKWYPAQKNGVSFSIMS